ncbi:MAG: cell wall hydrolase [Clostridia bacterium]|nr:cell wall hydrolase [Clostridia bacterium]
MKKHKVSNKIMGIFFIAFLFILLYISINYADEIEMGMYHFKNHLYAATESSTSTNKPASGSEMTELLARLINGEARGEPYEGQVAVGAVILNRVKSTKFPNTIAGVIYQNTQFSCVKDGQFDVAIDPESTVYKAAEEAMSGSDPTNGALYFYNPAKTTNKFLYSLETTMTIGKHRFALGEK